MDSIFSKIFLALQEQIEAVPGIEWVDQDLGQMENYSERPALKFPCVLIDFDETDYSNLGQLAQIGDGIARIRLAFAPFSNSNNKTPAPYRQKALGYYELEYALNQALHGWGTAEFGPMVRVSADTERRNDPYRVRLIRYTITFEDLTTVPAMTSHAAPGLEITPEIG